MKRAKSMKRAMSIKTGARAVLVLAIWQRLSLVDPQPLSSRRANMSSGRFPMNRQKAEALIEGLNKPGLKSVTPSDG
jgi:hypothetical protein